MEDRNMINLTKAPFFLVKEDIEWVENTKKAMTLEEKIGQLFVPIGYSGCFFFQIFFLSKSLYFALSKPDAELLAAMLTFKYQ